MLILKEEKLKEKNMVKLTEEVKEEDMKTNCRRPVGFKKAWIN